MLHDGSQLSFRAPLQTQNAPATSSSTTQLAFSSLVSRENQNLQRRQQRRDGLEEVEQVTMTPVTRLGFGELGRQSLEEDKRREELRRADAGREESAAVDQAN